MLFSALEGFLSFKRNALHKSTFYLLTYLLTYFTYLHLPQRSNAGIKRNYPNFTSWESREDGRAGRRCDAEDGKSKKLCQCTPALCSTSSQRLRLVFIYCVHGNNNASAGRVHVIWTRPLYTARCRSLYRLLNQFPVSSLLPHGIASLLVCSFVGSLHARCDFSISTKSSYSWIFCII